MIRIEMDSQDLHAIKELGEALTRIAAAKAAERHYWQTVAEDEPGPAQGAMTVEDGDASCGPESLAQERASADTNGVPFNADFCSGSANAFNADGTWRRRRGVSKQDFEAWYSGAKTLPLPQLVQDSGLHEVDTQAAFAPEPEAAAPAFKNPGEFMGWVAEQQAAGHVTQADVQAAYTQLGIGLPDIFGDGAEAHINNLHGILVAKVLA